MSQASIPESRGGAADEARPGVLNGLHLSLLVLGAVAAFSFGFLLIDRAGDSDRVEGEARTELSLWAALIGAVCAYAVFGGLFLVRSLAGTLEVVRSVPDDEPERGQRASSRFGRSQAWWRRHPTVRWLLEILLMLGIIFFGLFRVTRSMMPASERYHQLQMDVVTVLSIVAVIPGLIGLLATRSIADHDRYWSDTPLRRVRLVQRLRGDAKRSVFILGGFLTLIVVTTGARRRAVLALNPEASFPVEYVLLYGLVFAGVLGSTYWLASAALDRRVSHLVDQYASIPSPDLSDDQLSAAVERRARVAQLLSSGESTWTTLQTGIVILGPLITGIISAVLPEQ